MGSENIRLKVKPKRLALKVRITYSPAPNYRERLAKVVALLLRLNAEQALEKNQQREEK